MQHLGTSAARAGIGRRADGMHTPQGQRVGHTAGGDAAPVLYWRFRVPVPIMPPERFEGSSQYAATDDLKLAVNAAITPSNPSHP
ncbi:hypothetical protein SAMN04487768_2721 [Burkholderia sp. b13]|nr:hypothetical protein SAMN04487768_2721 [Burkholderia sp. b13]